MVKRFDYEQGPAQKALSLQDWFVWDCAVIHAEGEYHMFSSRWPEKNGFGHQWLYNSEVIRSTSKTPEGPYVFQEVVLPRRGSRYFDGMNTHNTCIRCWNGKYYLYYMGCTYGGEAREDMGFALETWNRKRIGVAVADRITGPFIRQDVPLLEPRDCSCWDCTAVTNPTAAILPDGTTYLIYKSRRSAGSTLKLGVAVAEAPTGPFRRLTEDPILQFSDPDWHIEDPFLWYDGKRKKFCLLAKDDSKHGSAGITGEWGSGFYAESEDCVHFQVAQEPKAYSRRIRWADGQDRKLCNLERPGLLFDGEGNPTHLFCAAGEGPEPYQFTGSSYILVMPLNRKQDL